MPSGGAEGGDEQQSDASGFEDVIAGGDRVDPSEDTEWLHGNIPVSPVIAVVMNHRGHRDHRVV
jgi:hypothetical protein